MKNRRRYAVTAVFASVILSAVLRAQEFDDADLDSLLNIPVSSASRYWQQINEAPGSVSIITHEEIRRYGYQTLEDVFRSVRGFSTSYDRNYSYLGVRGFGRPTDYNNRILLLINGHPINESVYGSMPIGTDFGLNLKAVDRIEIVRGPGSALWGTGAMFAIINIVTKKGIGVDGLDAGIDGGSYGRNGARFLFGKEFDRRFDVTVSGQWFDIEGQDLYFPEFDSINNGIVKGADWTRGFGLHAMLRSGAFSLQSYFDWRRKGIPTASYGTIFGDTRSVTLDIHRVIEAQYSITPSPFLSLLLRGYGNFYTYHGEYAYATLNVDGSDATTVGGETQVRWDFHPRHHFIAGVELKHNPHADYRYRMGDQTVFNDNFPFSVLSLYAQDEWQIVPPLTIIGGARFDRHSSTHAAVSPRIALLFHPSLATTVKLLYGRAFRAPNIYERYYEDPMSGFVSNRNIRPEYLQTGELILEHRLIPGLYVAGALYTYSLIDLIEQKPITDTLFHFENTSRVNAVGAEIGLIARFESGLNCFLNYSHQSVHDGAGNRLSNAPRHLLKGGFSAAVQQGFSVAVDARYETERRTVYGTSTPSFLLLNTNVVLDNLYDNLSASVSVRNLMNTHYKLPGGFEHVQHAIAQDGINFILGLSYVLR